MALFLIQFQGKRLCPLSGHDLSKLLEIGALRGQDPLYSYSDKTWYYIDECSGFAKFYDDTPRKERTPLPTFTPPPLDSLQIVTLCEIKEIIKEVVIEKEVRVEVEVESQAPIEKVVEHYIEPDPGLYIERESYDELLDKYQVRQVEHEVKVEELKEKLETCYRHTEEIRSQSEQYFQDLKETREQLIELSDSERVISKLHDQIIVEKKKVQSLTFNLMDIKEELLLHTVRSEEFERDSKELVLIRSKLESEIETYKRENSALKLFVERTSPDAIAIGESKTRQYDSLKKQFERAQKLIQEKEEKIDQLESSLLELEKVDVSQIERDLRKSIRQEFQIKWQEEKEKQLQSSIKSESTFKDEVSALEHEIEKLRAKNILLEEELENKGLESKEQGHILESDYQDLKNELSEQAQREVRDYKELLKRREAEIASLSSELVELRVNAKDSAELEAQLVGLEAHHNSEDRKKLEKSIALLEKEKVKYRELLEANKELKDKIKALSKQEQKRSGGDAQLKSTIEELQKRLAASENQSNLLKQKFNKAIVQNQKYKHKLEEATAIIDKLKSKTKVKSEEISKLKGEVDKLSNAPTQIINMKEIGLTLQSEAPQENTSASQPLGEAHSEEELSKLIGDSFEVPNFPEWKIKTDEGIQGPYTYSEMLELKNSKQIDEKTPIKKKAEGTWKALKEFFELTTKVITHKVTIDGEEVTKFYIKRGSFRAPFYEVCSFDLSGNEVRGHCTSLSIGGAFIELNRVDNPDQLREKKIFLRFSKGALTAPFGVQAIIKNVSDVRPKGIGVMFVDLPEHGKDAIIEYINTYLEKLSSGAA